MMKLSGRLLSVGMLASGILLQACNSGVPDALLTGYVEAELIHVAASSAGRIASLSGKEGDEVAAGDIMFVLEQTRELAARDEAKNRLKQAEAQLQDLATGARDAEIRTIEAQLREAQANFRLADTERRRIQKLVEQEVLSEARRDEADATYNSTAARVEALEQSVKVARLAGRSAVRDAAAASRDAAASALEQAEWYLSERTVRAGVSGRIEEIFYREGEYVNQGEPVLAIFSPERLKIRFFVTQTQLPQIGTGDIVTVFADGLKVPVNATITHIAREAEFTPPVIYSASSREKLVFLVEARPIDGVSLRPGLPVDVQLP